MSTTMTADARTEAEALADQIDKGWDQLGRGDLEAARTSADTILKLFEESPEGHALLGAIASASGEPEEALEHFQRAIELDADYLEPILFAAEVCIDLGDTEGALALCDDADELELSGEEQLDVTLLRAEAYLTSGDLDSAGQMAMAIPPPPYADPKSLLRAGHVFVEVGRLEEAVEAGKRAVEIEELRCDGHYFLGQVLEVQGKHEQALDHFLLSHELESTIGEPPWAVAGEQFEKLVEEAYDELHPSLRARLNGVPRQIAELPSPELIAEGFEPRAMVYFAGVPSDPLLEASGSDVPEEDPAASRRLRLTGIFVYRRNVLRFSRSLTEAGKELGAELEREARAFFALMDPEGQLN
jgi:tetratricopeptide (TPR) repeat protein